MSPQVCDETVCSFKENLRGLLAVVSGPAGSGKTSLVNELIRRSARKICRVVTATTRPARPGEKDGVDYIFLTKKVFQEKIQRKEFLEYNIFNYNYYGTLRAELERNLNLQRIVVLIIDVNGAEAVHRAYPAALRLFVLPPTRDVLQARLHARGTEKMEDIEKRLLIAENEITRLENYDYLVVNDNFEMAVADTLNIIHTAHSHHIRGGELQFWQTDGYKCWHKPLE